MSFAVDRNLQNDVKPACVELSVSMIRTNGGTQARTQMNFLTVEDYADFLATGGTLPPIEVVFDGQEYWLWDGFHRIEAHVRAGLVTIKANVRPGTLRDAILLSVGANANHGLRRTPEDKRRSVSTLLNDNEWSKWSDSEIAKRCGVSHPFVGKMRIVLTGNVSGQNNYRSYTNQHGDNAVMDTAGIKESNILRKKTPQPLERSTVTYQPEGWQPDVSATRATAALKTFFRYPGGKSKIAGALVKEITGLATNGSEYREPFVGGGGIFLPVLSSRAFNRYWINDLDFGIYNVWLSVRHFSEELINRVRTFTPSVEAFYTFKETLSGDCTRIHPAEVALMKIAIHQISYSGLGTRAGGPIGGIGQKSQYDVSCRWNGENVAEQIRNINDAMRGTEVIITNMDYRAMLTGSNAVVYLDPPYYDQGNNLYQVRFSEQDHKDLADKLSTAKYQWVLSYDKCDDVRNLYQWANVRETEEIHYSITLKSGNAGKQSRFASEYVIAGGGH